MDLLTFVDDITPYEPAIYESVGGEDGRNKILAHAVGQFFVPGGVSRNKRYYPPTLWPKILESATTQTKLRDGMLGTLLHPEPKSKFSHPMYASHVVKKLWIEGQNKGMGEAYILDTPVGRIVDTFQKSGLVKLYVSSRAYGKYVDGKTYQGMPIVDENHYMFNTFDWVLEPGFLEAAPEFVGEQLVTLAECYLDNYQDLIINKIEAESRAKKLERDINFILRTI